MLRKCPHCAEMIPRYTNECPFCRKALPLSPQAKVITGLIILCGMVIFPIIYSVVTKQASKVVNSDKITQNIYSADNKSLLNQLCETAKELGYKKGQLDRPYGIYDKHSADDFYDYNRKEGLTIELSTEAQMCFKEGYDKGFYNRLFK